MNVMILFDNMRDSHVFRCLANGQHDFRKYRHGLLVRM